MKKQITFVLQCLEERAPRFKKEHGRSLVIFIDGVDLLAKECKTVFTALVDRAKHIGNKGAMKIVLVSSEGHVMPLINETSSKTRCVAKVFEILDMKPKSILLMVACRNICHMLFLNELEVD